MRLPALAILLDRSALDALGRNRSDEQRGHGNGGECDGDVTHGCDLLGVVSFAFSVWIFRIICLCEIYIHGNVIYARALGWRSLIVNEG
jgi:hypothetical protein